MPLVFAESERTASGITYNDHTGVLYQYPKRYRRIIRAGELFVYYRGRRRRGGGQLLQIYFGAGVVGRVMVDPNTDGRLICEIVDYLAFAEPVPFKDERGLYLETGAESRGYFQPGVRVISDEDFRRILVAGAATAETPTSRVMRTELQGIVRQRGQGYAAAEVARAVDEFAMRIAEQELGRRYKGATVVPQPHNNPGFDILLRPAGEGDEVLYVEVKGTQGGSPRFFLSEGERRFSSRQGDRFRLVVVHSIRLDSGTYEVAWHEGPISSDEGVWLHPTQWACELGPSAAPECEVRIGGKEFEL